MKCVDGKSRDGIGRLNRGGGGRNWGSTARQAAAKTARQTAAQLVNGKASGSQIVHGNRQPNPN